MCLLTQVLYALSAWHGAVCIILAVTNLSDVGAGLQTHRVMPNSPVQLKKASLQVTAIIYTSPLGIASLIAANLCKIQNLAGTVRALGMYIGVYLTGLAAICLVMYPMIYWMCTRRSPVPLYRWAPIMLSSLNCMGPKASRD